MMFRCSKSRCSSALSRDEIPVASTVWFHAFDEAANSLIKHARKGDQLIVEALVCGATAVLDWHSMQ